MFFRAKIRFQKQF